MADTKISDLTALTGANVADDDEFVIVDTSAAQSKRITRAELAQGLYQGDNVKAIFGAGSDLQIYHDPSGPSSLISDQGAGDLILRGSNQIRFQDATGLEHYAIFNENGAVQLYYDNSAKLTTTSTGIDVTGTVTADGLTVDGDASVITLNNTDTSLSLGQTLGEIKFNQNDPSDQGAGTVASIYAENEGSFAGYGSIKIKTGGATSLLDRFEISANGDISFYDSTGTSQNLFWDASASSLGIGTTSPDNKLIVNGGLGATGAGSYGAGNVAGAYLSYEGGNEARLLARSVGTASSLSFWTSTTSSSVQRMTIDSSGRVGIGLIPETADTLTSVTAGELQVDGNIDIRFSGTNSDPAGTRYLNFVNRDTTLVAGQPLGGLQWVGMDSDNPNSNMASITSYSSSNTGTTGDIRFKIAGAEAARIDSSKNLLVGQLTASDSAAGVYIQSGGRTSIIRDGGFPLRLNRLTSDGDLIEFNKDGATVGSIGAYSGSPYFSGTGAGIRLFANGVVPTTSTGVSADGTKDLGTSSVRFRDLYLSGGVNAGVTGSVGAGDSGVNIKGLGQIRVGRSGTATVTLVSFNNDNGEIGRIQTSGSSTSYITSSDYRLKENVTELTGAIDRIKQVPVHRFNFTADPDKTVDGFLAHEVQAIVPEAISGEKDGMRNEEYEVTPAVLDDDGNVVTEAVMGTREVPDYQGIDQSKLVPLLTQALKDAITKIETLETRISALEGVN